MNFKNKKLWVAVASLVAILLATFGVFAKIGMTPEQFNQIVEAFLNVATEAELIQ